MILERELAEALGEPLDARRYEALLVRVRELRANFEELLAAQERCGDCDSLATRHCHHELFYCDNPDHGWKGLPDLEIAPLIRRLTK